MYYIVEIVQENGDAEGLEFNSYAEAEAYTHDLAEHWLDLGVSIYRVEEDNRWTFLTSVY